MSKLKLVTIVVAGVSLSGCSWLQSLLPGSSTASKQAEYKSQGGKIPTLEVPPDLTSPIADDRFVIPDPKGSTSYSTYNRERNAAGVVTTPSTSAVLPKVEGAQIVKDGGQRWLTVKLPPDKAWPLVRDFWKDSGFQLTRETPEAGILETDWAENRSKLPQDIVRNTIGRVVDGLYSTGERDKFRTRVEAGNQPGTTDVYISHRGLQEVLTGDQLSTVWQPRPNDPDLELEMMSRLMVRLGGSDKAAPLSAAAAGATPAGPARAMYDASKGGKLTVNEAFDRAWRRIGLALDRIGFTVEDRDRSKGLFFVRYIDPDSDSRSKADKSHWYSWMLFWNKDEPGKLPQYRLFVSDVNGVTSVEVQTSEGKPDSDSATAKRMLGLLLEQLK